jgi:PAS domain S-box-containing protein
MHLDSCGHIMKQSLEKRIVLFSFLILSMTILANTAMEIAMFRKEYVQEILLRSQTLGSSLKSSIEKVMALGIDIRDVIGLSEKCREVVQTDPDLSYCVITDTDGKTLFSSSPSFAALDFATAHALPASADSRRGNFAIIPTAKGNHFDIQIPVHSFDSKTRAFIHIGFPQQAIDQKVQAIILRSFVTFLIFFSISFALVILFVKRSIIAPITRLLEGVTRISRGDFKSTIQTLPVYELDQLGIKINAMSTALETHDRELHNNYSELSETHTHLHNSYLQLEKLTRDLKKSEGLYKRLQEEAGDAIILLDGSEKVIAVNKMAEKFFGFPASKILGQHISSLLVLLNAENIPHHLKRLEDAYGGLHVDDEISITNSGHEPLVGRIHAGCVTMDDNSLLQIIIRDVTKERQILMNLESSAEGLARLNRMKDSFLGMASHELKTPLTVIMGYSELLLTDLKDQLTESTAEMVESISTAAARLDTIIKDIVDVSLIDQKKMELAFDRVDINALIESAVREFRYFLMVRQQEIAIHLDPALPMIRGDQTRLMQLFSKILANAVKFTPDGGTIYVTTALRQLDGNSPFPRVAGSDGDTTGTMPQQAVEIVIRDTGIGIDSNDQKRIFDKFYEVGNIKEHSSGKTSFKAGGTGLGLSIAKGIVDMHGGRIWVESPGYDPQTFPGSSFIILLPIDQPAD